MDEGRIYGYVYPSTAKTAKCCVVAVSIWVVLLSRAICSCQHVFLPHTTILIIIVTITNILIIVTSIIFIVIGLLWC